MSGAAASSFVPPPEIIRRSGFRWGLALAAVLAATTVFMSAMIYWLGSYALFRTVDKSIVEQLELLAARPPDLLPFMIASRMNQGPRVVTRVGLFGPDRRLLVGDITAIPDALRLDGRVQMILSPSGAGEPRHERFAGRRLPDGRVLVVARDVEDLLATRAALLQAVIVALIPAILLSIAGGMVVGMRAQRRLVQLRQAAERIVGGGLEERLPARVPGDELDQLSAIVNRMLDRLQDLVYALKGVGEDIAHDLRTPLTAVRARLERGREHAASGEQLLGIIDQSIAGIDQALAIITALLRIAEVENGRRYSAFAEVDLAELVAEAGELYQPVAEDKGIALTVLAAGPGRVRGDRDLLLEVVVNLLDNAIKFTPPGGHVRVELSGAADRPLLRVADDGPGIPESEHELVFRRFYRSDRSRGSVGIGLGLSLVAAVARLHGFGLSLADNHPGCVVELRCWDAHAAGAAEPAQPVPGDAAV